MELKYIKRKTAGNIGLAKAGQTEVIEHLCYIWADGFQSPAFAKLQNVVRYFKTNFTMTAITL